MSKRILAMLLAIVMAASCLPAGVMAENEPHIHCACGKQKTLDAACESCGTKAVEWTATDTMPTAAGNYYLTKGVSTEEVTCHSGNVSICLHGNEITSAAKARLFKVSNGAAVTITDCKQEAGGITGCDNASGGAMAYLESGAALKLYNGRIYNNKTTGNGIIYLKAGAAFQMYGGEISGNRCARGTVFTDIAAKDAATTVQILGGQIKSNTGTNAAASTGGGAGIYAFCNVVVGGNAVISGNTGSVTTGTIPNENIYLRNDRNYYGKLTLSEQVPLNGAAKIDFGFKTEPASVDVAINRTAEPADWSCSWLTYEGQTVSYVNGKFVPGHYHGDREYTPITNNSELSKATGYAYLTCDLSLGGEQNRSKDLNLCLNGYTITAKKDKRVFTTAKNAGITFAIEDCSAYTDEEGVYHAGTLTGGSNTGVNGGGAMYLAAGNTLHLYDGILTNNTATVHGGALTIMGTLYLHGGKITGNTSASAGGIYVDAFAKVYVDDDPFVYDNKQGEAQSNLYLAGSNVLNIDTLDSTAKIGISAAAADRAISNQCKDYTKQVISDNAEYTVSVKAGALFLGAPVADSHCICGSTSCTSHESVDFVEWKSGNSLPGSGNICLSQNVTLTEAVVVNGELNLCLRGHTITQTGNDRVFKLDKGSLTITDCADSYQGGVYTGGQVQGGVNDYGAAVVVMEGTTFNLYGGRITGSRPANPDKAGTGAAIFLRSSNAAGATFNMYGGEITDNGNELTWGGAVTNGSGNANNAVYVNIYGGKIFQNTAGTGGAIRLENKSVLTVSGGQLTDNTATNSGGAIYLSKGAVLNLKGGRITGNKASVGGGIYTTTTAGAVLVSGDPVVTNNTAADKQNNLYLSGDRTITLGDVAQGAKVGIAAAKGGVAISTQSNTDYTANFISDSSFKTITYQDGLLYIQDATGHQHCDCAGAASGCGHLSQVWTAWESTTSLPTTSGRYYLTGDVQLTALVKMEADQKICLCLNGKTVKAAENTGHMILTKGTELSITDCSDTPGGFTGGSKAYGGVVNVVAGSTLNLYGGELYGNTAPSSEGGAVYLQGGNSSGVPGGIFNMYGGKIRDNTAGIGGGIRAAGLGDDGKIPNQVNIYGGQITGNKTIYKLDAESKPSDVQGEGAAIAATLGTVVNIYGGTISQNIAEDDGGAIYANNNAQVNIKGGKLLNNEAKYGGAIFTAAEGTAAIMDGGELSGNKATVGGAVMIQSRSVFTMNGGRISANTASSGAGVYASTNTDFVMNDGQIGGNIATGSAGGFYALRSRVTLNGGQISGNKAAVRGGAFVSSGATVVLNKILIKENTAKEGGTAYINRSKATDSKGVTTYNPSNATINEGAVITGNVAQTNCGGVIVANPDVVLTMNGGEISKNTAASGGAVMTWSGATFVLKGGKISGNTASGSGGALYISTNSAFQMEGGEISNNTANGNGGAVYALASQITVTGGTIKGNTAASAGAIFLLRANGEFKGGTVSGNQAKAKTVISGGVEKPTGGTAGAVYLSGAKANLRGTSFSGNRAGTNGGAIVLGRSTYTQNGIKKYSDSLLNIYGGTISGNSAGKVGGAMLIQSQGTVVNMYGGTISNNKSVSSAGGVYVSTNTTFNMTGGAIVNNASEAAAGGMYALRSKVTITGGQLHSNTAVTSGAQMIVSGDTAHVLLKNLKLHSGKAKLAGAVVIQSQANFTAENCDFYDNSTESSAGAVYVSTRTTGNFVGCKFYNNATKGSAGAVTAANFSTVNITDCYFTENTAGTMGGAIYANPASLTTIKNSTFNKCSAGTRGGAITCKGSMFVIDSVIENSTAKNEGGAVYTDINTAGGSGVQRGLVVEGSQIRNNASGGVGGAFYIYKGCRLELYDSKITGNTSPAEGGAIWAYEDLELHNTEITGNASGGEGFAVYKPDSNYDGHSYTASVNKLSGSTIIKDNEGGDLWMGPDVVFAITGDGLGENAYINVTLDSGVLTSRILGAYHYEGGDQVYTITYGDRSMTDPETLPGTETETGNDGAGDIILYAGLGVFVLAVAVVVILLLRKKKATAKEPAGE